MRVEMLNRHRGRRRYASSGFGDLSNGKSPLLTLGKLAIRLARPYPWKQCDGNLVTQVNAGDSSDGALRVPALRAGAAGREGDGTGNVHVSHRHAAGRSACERGG